MEPENGLSLQRLYLMLSPVILFNLIMQIINGFMVFTQAYIITGGAPLDTTLFYSLYLYQKKHSRALTWGMLLLWFGFACYNSFLYPTRI